jgi:hypothetical protein
MPCAQVWLDFAEIYFPLAGFAQLAKTPKKRPWQSEILDISAWTTHVHIPTITVVPREPRANNSPSGTSGY